MRSPEPVPSPWVAELSKRYAGVGGEDTLPPALQAYASAQASALRHYATTNQYALSAFPAAEKPARRLRIRYRVISEDFAGLGYGLRKKNRGSGLILWIRTRGEFIRLASADWIDRTDDGIIELDDLEPVEGAFIWQWGYPVDVGITVAHTQVDNRNLIPDRDETRSRWNPLNYGVYPVETNHYPIATFASLEAMIRELYLQSTDEGTPVLRFDRVLDPEQGSSEAPELTFELRGFPPGRDLDWPAFLPPPNASDARALGVDIRNAASNLLEQVLGTP